MSRINKVVSELRPDRYCYANKLSSPLAAVYKIAPGVYGVNHAPLGGLHNYRKSVCLSSYTARGFFARSENLSDYICGVSGHAEAVVTREKFFSPKPRRDLYTFIYAIVCRRVVFTATRHNENDQTMESIIYYAIIRILLFQQNDCACLLKLNVNYICKCVI